MVPPVLQSRRGGGEPVTLQFKSLASPQGSAGAEGCAFLPWLLNRSLAGRGLLCLGPASPPSPGPAFCSKDWSTAILILEGIYFYNWNVLLGV